MPWLISKKRRQPPSSSTSEQPWAATSFTGAAELSENGLGRLHRAAARGDLAWLRRWRWYVKAVGIDRRDQEMRTPLHLASANGHADVVRYLIRKNSQPNLTDNCKQTALMKAVQQEQEECVAILLEHGADPNLADADGNTALHLAVLAENTAVARLLLEHNAKSDAQNQKGFTPLKLAVFVQHQEILQCLLKKAAGRHAPAQCERTALVVPGTQEAHPEEDNLRLQKELHEVDTELREEEEKHPQSEHCVRDLKTASDDKEREATTSAQKVQDLLLASSETNTTIKQLEEHVQHLASKNTRLEATVQQPGNSIEALQRDPQASDSVGELSQQLHVEPKTGMQLEAPNQNLQEQLSTLHGKCEKLENSKCQLQEVVTELHHQLKTSMLDGSQTEPCKREVSERADQETSQKLQDVSLVLQPQAAYQPQLGQIGDTNCDSVRDQMEERIRHLERELDLVRKTQQEGASHEESTHREMGMYRDLHLEEVKTRRCLAKKVESLEKLLRKKEKETQSQQEEMRNKYSAKVKEVDKLLTQVDELSQQLDRESKKCMQLEAKNQDFQEELSTLRGKCENLEMDKRQLQEELAKLRHHMETNMVDRSQLEQCKREVEEQADREIRQKLQEVNQFLHAQAAYQDTLKEIITGHFDLPRNQLENRIRNLECAPGRPKSNQQERPFQKESVQAEVDKYRELYLEEAKTRKSLAKKLERLEKLLRIDRLNEEKETQSQQEEIWNKYSAKVKEGDRLLTQQLDRESKKCMQLEVKTQILQEELSTLRGKCENLEMDKRQLQEELAKLRHHMETNMVDRSQLEQCKREVEEQADREIRQKLQEVNQFLHAQAASQDRLEQIRASHHASLRNQLKDRIRDSTFQKESMKAEVNKYKELYVEEVKTRKSLAEKLERAQERLAEANTKLLWESHRSKSLMTNSTVSIHLAASPLLDSAGLGHLGNSLGPNRSLGLRTQPSHMW